MRPPEKIAAIAIVSAVAVPTPPLIASSWVRAGHEVVTNDLGPVRTSPDGASTACDLTCTNLDEGGPRRTRPDGDI